MSRVLVDSGVSWLGKIPDSWSTCRVKNKFLFHKIIAKEKSVNYDRIALTLNGVIKRDKDDSSGLQPDNYNGYQIVYKDDLIFKLIDLENVNTSRIGKSEYEGITSPAYIVLTDKCNTRYSLYYFLNMWYQEIFNNIGGDGVRSAINKDDLLKVFFINAPIDEQNKIADYLDKQCKKINEIINDNNHEIELLEEYKKTLITEVITSGLNKNNTFKESQISWMGKIPSHYEVVTLKRLGTARNGLSYSPGEVADNGILVLRSSNIQNNKLSLNDNVYVKKEINECLLLKENDLLICSRNGSKNLIGKNILINKDMEGQTFGAFMCVYRSKYNKYIRYVLNSHIFDYYLANFLTSTINQLTTSNLYSIKIPFTYNIEEQEKIIKYLDKQCSKLDRVIEYRKQIIEKLEEYKKSLIFECVTGKREV